MIARTTNKIRIPVGLSPEGKSIIHLSGMTEVNTYVHINGVSFVVIRLGDIGKTQYVSAHCGNTSDDPDSNTDFRGRVTCAWDVDIILDGAHKGKLAIDTKNVNFQVRTEFDKSSFDDGAAKFISDMADDLRNKMTHEDWIGGFADKLRSLFQGNWSFVLAGKRDFSVEKAFFNGEGDLLCELKCMGG